MIGFPRTSRRALTTVLTTLALSACPADDPGVVTGDGSSGSTTDSGGTTNGTADETLDGSGQVETMTATETATSETCGDGNVDTEMGEACDDGNTADGDGCSASCQFESCATAWTWSEPIVTGDPGASDTTVDAMGNVYVVGDMVGPTDNDIWVAKWNPDGTQAWSQQIDSGNGIDVGLGVAVDDAGDVYLAARVTGDADAMYYARLGTADGSEVWSITIDSMFMDEDDIGIDPAITPDGDVILTGRLRVGDGDDDVWVSRRSAADGSEIWATTWSGMGDGSFSTDRVTDVAVSPDGNIWVAAREHVAFDTQESVLLGFDPDGNQTVASSPLADGTPHTDNPIGVAAYDGGAYLAVVRSSSIAAYRAWVYKFDGAGDELWSLTQDDWQGTEGIGEDYRLRTIAPEASGGVQLGGDLNVPGGPSDHEWREAWMSRLDGEGSELCRGGHMEVDDNAFAPVLFVFSGGSGPGGGMALSGRADEGAGIDSWLWTGYFAP
ncbi:MAG: hypothetical protein AB1Z98_24105 [Nannocystaceae bacterium]